MSTIFIIYGYAYAILMCYSAQFGILSVALVEVASQVLKRALATPEGSQFSADYKDRLKDKDYLFQYLFPFRSNKHSKVNFCLPAGVFILLVCLFAGVFIFLVVCWCLIFFNLFIGLIFDSFKKAQCL